MSSYYEILGCDVRATYEELKKAYYDLVLKHHPDKKSNSSDEDPEAFQSIDEAWKTLRDPEKRRSYDEALKQKELEEQTLIYGTFTLDQLSFSSDSGVGVYSCVCRCGGVYKITKDDLEQFQFYLVGCDQCSLMISIQL